MVRGLLGCVVLGRVPGLELGFRFRFTFGFDRGGEGNCGCRGGRMGSFV